jgi:glycosyltransferase involved in cell wall biosynthesis
VKIAVVTPIPTPYRDPFWEALAQQSDIDLSVIYCAAGKSDRPWTAESDEYTYQRLFPAERNLLGWLGWGSSCYWNPDITKHLKNIQPDVVLIGGYNHLTMLAAVRYCNRNRIPWLLMSESWRQRKGMSGAIKHRLIRHWLKSAAGALPTGTLSSAHLCRLGIPTQRQSFLPNVPDIQRLCEFSQQLQSQRDKVRNELGVPADRQLIVFAARMIEKKRPLLVIEAFSQMQHADRATLAMIGDGPLMAQAQALARQLGCEDRICFPGFVEPTTVHRWMAVADLFVQPSSETWGVAPIEALACGVPVVLSSEIGCQADVVTDATVGTVVPPRSLEFLRDALDRYSQSPNNYSHVRNAWQKWSQANTYTAIAAALKDHLRSLSHNRAGESGSPSENGASL